VHRNGESGTEWFIAVINGGEATSLDIPLGFLGDGNWKATRLYDTKDKPDAWDRQDGATTKADHIQLNLLPRAGFVAWLRKCRTHQPREYLDYFRLDLTFLPPREKLKIDSSAS
jgi:Glycosyl-hydrolase 97 C-terminal, oligomerisation